MNDYKSEYVFTRNENGRIVANSIDRMHNFILPIDINSDDEQNKIYDHFLKEAIIENSASQSNKENNLICVNKNQFENICLKLDDVVDQNVAKAICNFLIQNQYYTFDDGTILILEDADETIINKPILMKKWLRFYEQIIMSTKQAGEICTKAFSKFHEKFNQLPNVINATKEKAKKASQVVESLSIKKKKATLTPQENKMLSESTANFIKYGQLVAHLEEGNDSEVLEFMNHLMAYMKTFMDEKDIYILSYERAKAILELGQEAEVEAITYVVNLSKAAARISGPMAMLEKVQPDEITEENYRKYAERMGISLKGLEDADVDINDIAQQGAIAVKLQEERDENFRLKMLK